MLVHERCLELLHRLEQRDVVCSPGLLILHSRSYSEPGQRIFLLQQRHVFCFDPRRVSGKCLRPGLLNCREVWLQLVRVPRVSRPRQRCDRVDVRVRQPGLRRPVRVAPRLPRLLLRGFGSAHVSVAVCELLRRVPCKAQEATDLPPAPPSQVQHDPETVRQLIGQRVQPRQRMRRRLLLQHPQLPRLLRCHDPYWWRLQFYGIQLVG